MDYNMDNYPSIRTNESNADFIKRVNDWGIGFTKELIERLEVAIDNQKKSIIGQEKHGPKNYCCDIAFQGGRMWVYRGILGKYVPKELREETK